MGTGPLRTIVRPVPPPAADLPAGTCHVWWARPADAEPGWADILDADERARLADLPHTSDRRRFLTAHALCRMVLGAYLGEDPAALRFVLRCGACGGPHGKPALAGLSPLLEFSLTRAGDRIAVAVASSPIGLDVEELGRVSDHSALSGMVLRPAELVALEALPDERRPAAFLRYWTRKEAVLKALGVGRAVPPNRLEVSGPDDRPRLLACYVAAAPAAPVQLFDLTPGGGSAASLAVVADAPYRVEVLAGAALLRH